MSCGVVSRVRWKASKTHRGTRDSLGAREERRVNTLVGSLLTDSEIWMLPRRNRMGQGALFSQLIIQILGRQLLAQQQRNEECVFVAHC